MFITFLNHQVKTIRKLLWLTSFYRKLMLYELKYIDQFVELVIAELKLQPRFFHTQNLCLSCSIPVFLPITFSLTLYVHDSGLLISMTINIWGMYDTILYMTYIPLFKPICSDCLKATSLKTIEAWKNQLQTLLN